MNAPTANYDGRTFRTQQARCQSWRWIPFWVGASEHRRYRRDTANGFFREIPAERNCAHKFPVDKNWAATHPSNDARFALHNCSAIYADEDCVHVKVKPLKDANDRDGELFNRRALEDAQPIALHARANFARRQYVIRAERKSDLPNQSNENQAQSQAAHNFRPS